MESHSKEPELAPFYQGQIDVFCAPYAVLNALRFMHGIRPLEGRRLLHEALLDATQHAGAFEDILEQRTDYVSWVDAMLERQGRKGGILVEKPFAAARQAEGTAQGIGGRTGEGGGSLFSFFSRAGSKKPLKTGSEKDAEAENRAENKSDARGLPALQGAAGMATALPEADEVWKTLTDWLAGGLFRCALFQFVRYLPVAGGQIRHWSCCRAVEDDELVLYDCSREPGALQRIARSRLICDQTRREEERVLLLPHTIRLLRTRLS